MKKLIMVSLLLALSRGVFAIEPSVAEAMLPMVKTILAHGKVDFSPLAAQYEQKMQLNIHSNAELVAPVRNRHTGKSELFSDKKGSIAIIPLQGIVMKEDYCGSLGSRTIVSLLKQVNDDPNFIGSVVYIDSPGGYAVGNQEASKDIRALSRIKPAVGFVDYTMASAAVWLGSSLRHIVANANDEVRVGSIGAMQTLELNDPNGPKVIHLYSKGTTHKNYEYMQALEGNYDPIIENLTALNEKFKSNVRSNREGKLRNEEDLFTGKIYDAKGALSNGLIDQIGTMKSAISKVVELSKKSNNV